MNTEKQELARNWINQMILMILITFNIAFVGERWIKPWIDETKLIIQDPFRLLWDLAIIIIAIIIGFLATFLFKFMIWLQGLCWKFNWVTTIVFIIVAILSIKGWY